MPAKKGKQPKSQRVRVSGFNATKKERHAELERVNELSGYRVGFHEFYAEVDFDTLKKRNDRVEPRHRNITRQERKMMHLIKVAVYAALRNPTAMIQIHIHSAHQAGATPQEIYRVIDSLRTVAGGAARLNGLDAWRLVFRPDLPPLLSVVKLTGKSSEK